MTAPDNTVATIRATTSNMVIYIYEQERAVLKRTNDAEVVPKITNITVICIFTVNYDIHVVLQINNIQTVIISHCK